METDAIRDLFTKKQPLLLELRNYEGNNQFSEISVGDMGQQLAAANQHVGIIPVSYLTLQRHTFSFYLLQLMVSLILVPCLMSLLYECVLFSCVFFRPKQDCRLALLSTWVPNKNLYVLYFPKSHIYVPALVMMMGVIIFVIIQCYLHVTGIYDFHKSACFSGYAGVLSVEHDCWYS